MLTRQQRSPTPDLGSRSDLEPVDQGVTIGQIFAALRRRLLLILAVSALGTILATAARYHVTPVYTATATVVIDPSSSRLVDVVEQGGAGTANPLAVETEIELITSRSHLGQVIDQLSLLDDPRFQPSGPNGDNGLRIDLPEPLQAFAALLPPSWLIAVGVANEAMPQEAPAPAEVKPLSPVDRSVVEQFRAGLGVWALGQSSAIGISYTSSDPERAARFANAVAESYAASQVERKREAAGRAARWLEERMGQLQEAVRASEQTAAQFGVVHGLATGPGGTLSEQQLLYLNQQLTEIRAQQIATEAKLRRARAERNGRSGFDAPPEVVNSPFIIELRSQEAALLRESAELAQTFGERHPRMVDVRAKIAEIRDKIQLEAERAIQGIENELAMLQSRERAVLESVASIRQEIGVERQSGVGLRELEREAQANRQLYEMFLGRFKAIQEQEQIATPDVRVISRASVPDRPDTPGPRTFAMVGFTVSAMLGSFLALLLERLDGRVRSAAGLESQLGLTVLGLVPRMSSRRARQRVDHYIAREPFSGFAESVRSVLISLRLSEQGSNSSVVLITSALPEEGKTTFSISLATSAACLGQRTLLIDLDLRRPRLDTRLTKRRSMTGLVNYLNGLPDERLIQHEPRTGVDYILAGLPPNNPLELMQSPELRSLIEAARREYSLIILDSAPLLAVADTRVAAQLADRVILVSRWKRTDVAAVASAMRLLIGARAALAGGVITAVNMRKYKLYARDAGSYYGRYHQYRK